MKRIIEFLSVAPVQFLATVGLDGRHKVRPFQFMFVDNGKLWFCTGNQKDVYSEMQKHPYIELSAATPDNAWLRLSAMVVFEDNREVKNRVIAQNELVRSFYKDGHNPEFEVFYLSDGIATIADFSGSPPQTIAI